VKKIQRLVLLSCILFFSLFFEIDAFAFEDGDWQYWNTESVKAQLSKNSEFKMETEFRFGNNVSKFYYHHSDLGLLYKTSRWLTLGLNYRQIYQKKNSIWETENRPHFNGILKWNWSDVKFEDRNRFEYRVREGKSTSLQYRNSLTAKPDIRWDRISPYIGDEIFYDFEIGKLNCNWFYLGADVNLLKNLGVTIFYMWQKREAKLEWIDYNVLGSKLQLSF